jgi:uncharacterized membrane protein
MTTELWAVGLVIFASLIGAMGPILLKKGSANFSLNPIKLLKNYTLIGGLVLYGLATILFVPALKGGNLSVLYPLVSLSYVWTCLLSIKMLGEKMSTLKWLGIILIIVGVGFIGFSK